MTQLQMIAQSIIDVASAWGKVKGYGVDSSISALLACIAEGQLTPVVKNGNVSWRLGRQVVTLDMPPQDDRSVLD